MREEGPKIGRDSRLVDDGKRTGVYERQLDVVCRAIAKQRRECEGGEGTMFRLVGG